jgi:purine-binding chemotaxis protein CheW
LEAMQTSFPTFTGIRGEYLKGVTPERLIILNMARILSDPRIIVDEEVELNQTNQG